MAVQMIGRAYQAASSLYEVIPDLNGTVVIEVTSTNGTTVSKQVIAKPAVKSFSTSTFERLSYHLHTILLFTYSDVKTVLLPWTLFGLSHAFSASFFGFNVHTGSLHVLARTPQVMTWIWLQLIPFAIGNQSSPSATVEDTINKPWRPLPSGRITVTAASYIQKAAYVVAFFFSLRVGGSSQSIAIAILGYLYSSYDLSSKSWIARHFLNGLGFISFASGAMEVALGRAVQYTPTLTVWLRIIALIVVTGIQTADMYDQQGDAASRRFTLPLCIGDVACRWTIALPVLGWSVFCPYFCDLGLVGYVIPISLGGVVATRTIQKTSRTDDKKTYKLWNLWLVSIYCLPFMKVVGSSSSISNIAVAALFAASEIFFVGVFWAAWACIVLGVLATAVYWCHKVRITASST